MTSTSTPTMTTTCPTESDWPDFAPAWAQCASIDSSPPRTVTFTRVWTIPSMYRDTPNFEFVTVEQDWAADANDTSVLVPGTPRVIVGRDSMWLDYRAEKVAETLRAIASALDPITEDVTT